MIGVQEAIRDAARIGVIRADPLDYDRARSGLWSGERW